MGRALPVLAIVGAVLAALAAVVLVAPLTIIVPLFAIACAVVLFLRRTPVALAAGAVVLVLGVLGALGAVGSVAYKDKDTSFGISEPTGTALAIASGVAVAGAVVAVLWGRTTPVVGGIGLAAAALAILLAFAWKGSLADHSAGKTLLVGLLAVVTLVPAVALARNPEGTPVPAAAGRAEKVAPPRP